MVKVKKHRKARSKREARERELQNVGFPKEVSILITQYAGKIPNRPRRVRACLYCGREYGHNTGCVLKPKGYGLGKYGVLMLPEKSKEIQEKFNRLDTFKMYWFGGEHMTFGEYFKHIEHKDDDKCDFRALNRHLKYLSPKMYANISERVKRKITKFIDPTPYKLGMNVCAFCGFPSRPSCAMFCPKHEEYHEREIIIMTHSERTKKQREIHQIVAQCFQDFEQEYYH